MNPGLTRWDPFRSTSLLPSVSDPDFGFPSLFRDLRMPNLFGETERFARSWCPTVDVCEEADRILLTAELPGFTQDQVKVEIEGNVLTMSGERKLTDETSPRNYSRMERSYGHFVRSFTLPSVVDRNKIHATFQNGLLEIELPKGEESKPRQIQIEGGKKSSTRSVAA